jgi:streptogramin lyase
MKYLLAIAVGLLCFSCNDVAPGGQTGCVNGRCPDAGNGANPPVNEPRDPTDPECVAEPELPGCPCDEGSSVACYTGPESTRNVGICSDGVQRCTDRRWAVCADEVQPLSQEVCNRQDDNCNGETDEGVTNQCGTCGQNCGPALHGPANGTPFDEPVANSGLQRDDDGNIGLVPGEAGEVFETNYLWVANSGEATVSKVHTINLREVARYPSVGPNNAGLLANQEHSPSRTAIDLVGDAYVANRFFEGQGSVTKFATREEDCVDRNRNGRIETSRDANNNGIIDVNDPNEFVGQNDECILWTVAVGRLAAIPRALAIDLGDANSPNGNVWVGCFDERTFYKLSGVDGSLVAGLPNPVSIPHSPYGAVLDADSILWSTSLGAGVVPPSTVVGIDTTTHRAGSSIGFPRNGSYGIAIDGRGRLWFGGFFAQLLTSYDPRIDANGHPVADPLAGGGAWRHIPTTNMVRGVSADGQGRIWAATNEGGSVAAWDTDTLQSLGNYRIGGAGAVGVGVDFQGYVWGISQSGNVATRIDPDGILPNADVSVGQSPYTYSDFSGFSLRQFARPRGTYRQVIKGCDKMHTAWEQFDADTVVPPGTRMTFSVRVGPTEAVVISGGSRLGPWSVTPGDTELPGDLFAAPTEPFMAIEVQMTSDDPQVTPLLRGFSVTYDCNP